MKNSSQGDINFYKTSKFDLLLIILILLISVSYVFGLGLSHFRRAAEKKVAFIYQQNNLLEQVGLRKDNLTPILNGRMQIEIKGGKLRVLESDCPQQLCLHMGWIQHSGQTIACVPNKVLIEIKSTGAPMFDAVSF